MTRIIPDAAWAAAREDAYMIPWPDPHSTGWQAAGERLRAFFNQAPTDPWLPIESAPRDDTDIIVFSETFGPMLIVAWDDEATDPDWPWATLDGPNYHKDAFTHWQPLPSPPAKDQPK